MYVEGWMDSLKFDESTILRFTNQTNYREIKYIFFWTYKSLKYNLWIQSSNQPNNCLDLASWMFLTSHDIFGPIKKTSHDIII